MRVSETCVACGAFGVAGGEGQNVAMQQCSKPRSTGGGGVRSSAVRQQAKVGWLRLRGGQAGSNPGLGAAGDVVDHKALGLQVGLQGLGGLSAAAT